MWRLTPYVVSADGVVVGNGLPVAVRLYRQVTRTRE
jgi:hypothetical protein